MGVYIKGMEMPTRCAECWLMDGEDSWCTACRGRHLYPEYRYCIKDRPGWCPLIPVPPHGRLIDADAEVARVQNLYNKAVAKDPEMGCISVYEGEIAVLKLAPTVIPASEEGE